MKIEDYVIPGRHYDFDCEYLTPSGRRAEIVGGVVLELLRSGTDTFVILNDNRAVNVRAITRVIGPYLSEVK